MERYNTLIEQVPAFAHKDSINKEIYSAQAQALTDLDDQTLETFYQLYVDTATWGLRKWEEMLGLTTDLSKTHEDRRSAIRQALMTHRTINKEFLEAVFLSYGYDNIVVEENIAPYIINITIDQVVNPVTCDKILEFLREVFPAHINGILSFSNADTTVRWLSEKVNPASTKVLNFYSSKWEDNALMLDTPINPEGTIMNLERIGLKRTNIREIELVPTPGYKAVNGTYGGSDPNVIGAGGCKVSNNFIPRNMHYWDVSYSYKDGIDINLRESQATGDYVEITFEGTSFELMALKSNCYGIARILVDGVQVQLIDLYHESDAFHEANLEPYNIEYGKLGTAESTFIEKLYRTVFKIGGLSQGIHTVRMEDTGTSNPRSTSARINYTAFAYEPYRALMTAGAITCLNKDNIAGLAPREGSLDFKLRKFNFFSRGNVNLTPSEQEFIELRGYSHIKIYGKKDDESGSTYCNFTSKGSSGYNSVKYMNNYTEVKMSDSSKNVMRYNDYSIGMDDFNTGVSRFELNYTQELSSVEWIQRRVANGTGNVSYVRTARIKDFVEDKGYNPLYLFAAAYKNNAHLFTVASNGVASEDNVINLYNQRLLPIGYYGSGYYHSMRDELNGRCLGYNSRNKKAYFKTLQLDEYGYLASVNTCIADIARLNSSDGIKKIASHKNKFQESDAMVTNGWSKIKSSMLDTGKGSTASVPGKKITIEFFGDRIAVHGLKGPDYGKVKITLENREPVIVDCYSPTLINAELYSVSGLPVIGNYAHIDEYREYETGHKLVLEPMGECNRDSTGNKIVFDYAAANENDFPYGFYEGTGKPGWYSWPFSSFIDGMYRGKIYCLEKWRDKTFYTVYDEDMYIIKRIYYSIYIAGKRIYDDSLPNIKLVGSYDYVELDENLNLLGDTKTHYSYVINPSYFVIGNGEIYSFTTEKDTSIVAACDGNFKLKYKQTLGFGNPNKDATFLSKYGELYFRNKGIGSSTQYFVFD